MDRSCVKSDKRDKERHHLSCMLRWNLNWGPQCSALLLCSRTILSFVSHSFKKKENRLRRKPFFAWVTWSKRLITKPLCDLFTNKSRLLIESTLMTEMVAIIIQHTHTPSHHHSQFSPFLLILPFPQACWHLGIRVINSVSCSKGVTYHSTREER